MADTRTSKEFSITIRPGEATGVQKYEKDLLEWLDREATHYVVAYEQKGDLSTQHFQLASIFQSDKRSDHLKQSLVGMFGDEWSPDMKKHAVCVNKNRKNNDIRLLAGGYCMKQDTTPFIKGWTPEELEPFQEQYNELKEKAERRNLTREKLLDVLKSLYDELANHKSPEVRDGFSRQTTRSKVKFMYDLGIRQGYDLSRFHTPQLLSYYTEHFESLFENTTAEALFGLLSDASV